MKKPTTPSEMGKKGGKQRWLGKTKKEIQEHTRMMAVKRWSKKE